MQKKKTTKTNLTVTVDVEYYDFLKKLSYRLSAKENKKVGLSEMVRRALESSFPIPPEQGELF